MKKTAIIIVKCAAFHFFHRSDESKHALFWLAQFYETRGVGQKPDARESNRHRNGYDRGVL